MQSKLMGGSLRRVLPAPTSTIFNNRAGLRNFCVTAVARAPATTSLADLLAKISKLQNDIEKLPPSSAATAAAPSSAGSAKRRSAAVRRRTPTRRAPVSVPQTDVDAIIASMTKGRRSPAGAKPAAKRAPARGSRRPSVRGRKTKAAAKSGRKTAKKTAASRKLKNPTKKRLLKTSGKTSRPKQVKKAKKSKPSKRKTAGGGTARPASSAALTRLSKTVTSLKRQIASDAVRERRQESELRRLQRALAAATHRQRTYKKTVNAQGTAHRRDLGHVTRALRDLERRQQKLEKRVRAVRRRRSAPAARTASAPALNSVQTADASASRRPPPRAGTNALDDMVNQILQAHNIKKQ